MLKEDGFVRVVEPGGLGKSDADREDGEEP
jgi:hypothetical protein